MELMTELARTLLKAELTLVGLKLQAMDVADVAEVDEDAEDLDSDELLLNELELELVGIEHITTELELLVLLGTGHAADEEEAVEVEEATWVLELLLLEWLELVELGATVLDELDVMVLDALDELEELGAIELLAIVSVAEALDPLEILETSVLDGTDVLETIVLELLTDVGSIEVTLVILLTLLVILLELLVIVLFKEAEIELKASLTLALTDVGLMDAELKAAEMLELMAG